MKSLVVNALYAGMAAALAIGLAACSHEANADAGAAGVPAGAQSAAPPADNGVQYAQVVSVTPVRQDVNSPQQVCHDVVVNHTVPPKDQHNIAGTAVGAVAGGLLGHLVGGGKGNTLATVAGAVGGGYAGNRIEAAHNQGQVVSSVEHRCTTVNNPASQVVAYDVTYVYNGVTRTTRMDHDPGNRVQVQQGVTVVSDAH